MIDSLQTGGSERQFAALARSLDPASFGLHLGCIHETGGFGEGLGKIAEFRLGGSLYGLNSLKTRVRLARHVRQRAIAIAHAFDFYTNLTLIPAARMARTPVVIGSQRQLGDLLTPAQARVQDMMFRWCDSVVCNSHAAAQALIHRGLPENRIVVIGNGLPPDAFARTPPALRRRPNVFRVGMIARMNSRSKKHLTFLRAADRLRRRLPGLEVLLVGDGPLRPELEREARSLGLESCAIFLGDRKDVSALLASMDISVLPSISESLSNVILESMAAGVPVVASRVGGNPELIAKDRGLLVPDDEADLAEALERLLLNPSLRAEFGENGRRFAAENFTVERVRKQYEQLYAGVLTEKGWRPHPRPFIRQALPSDVNRLRVAIVAASLRYVGGQSAQADLLCRNWQHDPSVAAWLVPVDPVLPRGLGWVNRVPFLRTIVREPLYLVELFRGLKNADIAHIFSASYWSFLLAPAPAWVVARLRGKKTLIHYHSGEARDHLRRFRTARPILRRADRLVVPSEYLADVFREFGLHAQVVPNIVDLAQFPFRLRTPIQPNLVCTRGFHRYYSVDLVVRAFAEVQRVFPHARLCLAGKGPEEKKIRDLVREMKLEGVRFSGVASRHEIGRLYDSADIFINASWLDNMPISILEAFACGTPVVTTAPEGIRYLVEHERTGLLSEPGDWQALAANAIRILRETKLASALALNAYEESRRYRWTAVRGQWLEVYRSLQGRGALGEGARGGGALMDKALGCAPPSAAADVERAAV